MQYNELPVFVRITELLNALRTYTLEDQVRNLAAIILRRLFSESEFQESYAAVSDKHVDLLYISFYDY